MRAAPSSSKRSWFSISLRASLILITIIGVICAIVRWYNVTVLAERRVIETLTSKFQLKYDWAENGGKKPNYPDWLRLALGCDMREHVVSVGPFPVESLPDENWPPDLDSELLAALNQLTSLRELDLLAHNLRAEQIARLDLPQLELLMLRVRSDLDLDEHDEALRHLGRFPQLKTLDICDRRVRAHDLGGLARLSQLEELSLDGRIDDQGLKRLATLHQLRTLIIDSEITDDESLACLKSLPHLTTLALDLHSSSEKAAMHIAACRSVTHLALRLSGSRGHGVRHINAMPNLTHLVLSGAYLSGDELELFAANPHLEELGLCECLVSQEDLKILDNSASLKNIHVNDFGLGFEPRY